MEFQDLPHFLVVDDEMIMEFFELTRALIEILPVSVDHGLPILFALSFLVATIGNFLGDCATYGLGYLGSTFVMHKIPRISDRETGKAMAVFSRYGSWSLLFSWLPSIGALLCLGAGSFKLQPLNFSIFLLSGKMARY